jgi:hypothetical protein
MLTFDEAAHVYYWHGKPVPNVTRIIAPLTDYSRIPPDVLQRAQEEGRATHKMVELDCKNDLDVETLPAWMRGHYTAWCRFKEESGFECWASEYREYHEGLGYAGTADLFGLTPKLPKIKGAINIDVKRSLYAGPAIGLQTAGYTEQWNRKQPKDLHVKHRAALVLKPDGTYRLQSYEDREDWLAFLACLQQLKWKEKHYG